MSTKVNFDYTQVKIKQEKPSPPRKKPEDEIVNEIIPKLFSTSSKQTSSDEGQDEKKAVEPVKSSNEILAELFRVFNATPPESLLNDNYLIGKKKKKHKDKDKKHKKKSKKREHDSSDGHDSSDDGKPKKKKKKKHKKHKKEHENDETKSVKIKEETNEDGKEHHKEKSRKAQSPLKDLRTSEISDFTISSEDENSPRIPDIPVVVKKEKDPSPKPVPGKIVIKCLKNSKVLEEAEKLNRRSRNRRQSNGDCSEISLSDEETFLREQEQRSRSRHSFHDRKSKERRSSRFSRDNIRNRSRDRSRRRWNYSRSRSRSRYWRRDRSRSRRPDDLGIDKKRLLEIARKNAISMFKNGSLPGTQALSQDVKDKVLLRMRYGGKTVEELTEFCKKLSNGESLNDLSSLSSNEDSDYDKHGNDKAFHHPFVLKDRGPIVMNIKNATPIPPKSADQTKAILMQYPVSSGQQHRLNENEWVPVPPTKPTRVEPPPVATVVAPSKPALPKNVFAKPLPSESQQPAFKPTIPLATNPTNQEGEKATSPIPNVTTPPTPAATKVSIPPEKQSEVQSTASIFPSVDVSTIIATRLNAMRKLQENPTDSDASNMMCNAQKRMTDWVNSFTPGLFTGSTGAKILTPQELTAGQQAWAKKDQLISTAPVSGGMGMHLLQKMGWKPGEGLGKTKNGCLQPLLLEVKMDKRGLNTKEEHPTPVPPPPPIRKKRPPATPAQVQLSIENKHPVSLLGELAGKRKWGPPMYELVNEDGPSHQKNFTFKVIINGMMYQPSIQCKSKKEAKALAAKYCLQQIGVLPT